MRYKGYQDDLFFRFTNERNDDDIYVILFGFERCKKDKTPSVEQKKFYLLHYVVSGHGTFEMNGKTYYLGKDDIFFIPPHATHKYCQDYKDPWSYIWFEFSGLDAEKMCDEALFSLDEPVYHCETPEMLNNLYSLLEYPVNLISAKLHVLSHFFKFLSQIIDQRNTANNKIISKKQVCINNIKYYIEHHYTDNDLNLNEISCAMYSNPSYLSRVFKEVTKINISKYIIETRMIKAIELLENTDYTMKEIAYRVGYSDPAYFTTEFKKFTGMPPTKYYKYTSSNSDKKLERTPRNTSK